MRQIQFLLILLLAPLLVMASEGGIMTLDQLLIKVDQMVKAELSEIDFSQDELKNLRTFIHRGIESKSVEEVAKNAGLIIENTQKLLDAYEEQNTTCKAGQESIGNDNYVQINNQCYLSTLKNLCPLYPFCSKAQH